MKLKLYIFLLLLWSSSWVFAEPRLLYQASEEKNEKNTLNDDSQNILEQTEILYPEEFGSDLSSQVLTLSNRLDSFFGEPRADDEKNGSTLKLSPAIKFYADQSSEFELGVNLNLKLKNLEKKAEQWAKNIQEKFFDENDNKTSELNSGPVDENQRWYFNLENKLVSRPAIYFGIKFRARRNIIQELFVHHISFEGGWDSEYYWHQISVLHSDIQIRENILFRFVNEAGLFFTQDRVITTHGPSLLQTINQYNSISYNARVYFDRVNNSIEHLNSTINVDFRNGTPTKKIYLDIVPEFSYPRINNYKEVKSIFLRLEYVFGDR